MIAILYYNTIVFLSCFILVILITLVSENARLPRYYKNTLYKTYATLSVAILAEWGSVFLNGAPMQTVFIHKIIKCMDYVVTPIVVIYFIDQLATEKKSVGWIRYILLGNAVLQLCSVFTGWTFYIDNENYYRHGPYFILYTLVYSVCIVYALVRFIQYGAQFKKRNRASLFMIITLLSCGIFAQEVISGEIRSVCLALTISSVLILLHTMEFSQMKKDEDLEIKQKLLETDPLTGLLSRYAYSVELERLEKIGRTSDQLTVFSIDINNLKKINDTLGHAAGDELIIGAADCLKQAFAEHGSVYRTGGDEFIAILEIDRAGADRISDELRSLTAAWHGRFVESLSLAFSYTRAAEFPDLKLEKLIGIADRRMYEEKSNFYIRSGLDRRRA